MPLVPSSELFNCIQVLPVTLDEAFAETKTTDTVTCPHSPSTLVFQYFNLLMGFHVSMGIDLLDLFDVLFWKHASCEMIS